MQKILATLLVVFTACQLHAGTFEVVSADQFGRLTHRTVKSQRNRDAVNSARRLFFPAGWAAPSDLADNWQITQIGETFHLIRMTSQEIADRAAAIEAADAAEVTARLDFANLTPEDLVTWKAIQHFLNQNRAAIRQANPGADLPDITNAEVAQVMRAIALQGRRDRRTRR